MSLYRDRGERTYSIVLDGIVCYHNDNGTTGPGALPYWLQDSPYDCLPFSSWTRVWGVANKFEAKYRAGEVDGYFFGWHNRVILMISPEKRANLYLHVPDWWRHVSHVARYSFPRVRCLLMLQMHISVTCSVPTRYIEPLLPTIKSYWSWRFCNGFIQPKRKQRWVFSVSIVGRMETSTRERYSQIQTQLFVCAWS